MRIITILFLAATIMLSCNTASKPDASQQAIPIIGTWQLISGTLIEKGDTTVTDYTKDKSQIKIINATHFAFLNHTLDKRKTGPDDFVAGGGHYTLDGDKYTENLEYCSARQWENNKFSFTVSIQNDTLIQTGVEKIDSIGVNRLNIEKYYRVK